MTDALKPLLENDLLTEEAKEQIKEAWEIQLKEAREEIEVNLREEFVARYEHDKGSLIEAVERMVTDGLEAEVAEFVQDRKALTEQRVKLANEIREARIDSKKKLAEQMGVLETFILNQLGKEIKEFEGDRKEVREAKKTLAKQLRESRVAYKTELTSKVELLEGFVLNQLKKELGEFHSDKKALVEQRVKMIKQGKAKIAETRKEFIKRSAKLVENTLEDVLRREMSQFKNDIEASRRKHFGMQMFEAFATEYKASFFNENKEVRGLLKRVNEGDKKLSQAKELFEKDYIYRQSINKVEQSLIALWSVARMERALKNLDLALELQFKIKDERANNDLDEGGYNFEELGEIYLLQGDESTAGNYFAKAHEILSKDSWLQKNEPDRLNRIKQLGQTV